MLVKISFRTLQKVKLTAREYRSEVNAGKHVRSESDGKLWVRPPSELHKCVLQMMPNGTPKKTLHPEGAPKAPLKAYL